MTQVMHGIKVLEVAQFVFVPAAGAVLAEWGADVIKVEHPLRGDAQRGMRSIAGVTFDPVANPMIQHPNKGKRSIGIDIATEDGQQLVYELAKDADVFLTNYLPSVRQKLKIDLEHIRKANPDIIYARGSGFGDKGPDRDRGGFDATAFYIHSGVAHALTPEEFDVPLTMGIGGMGDSQSGMHLAGGIAAALLRRERTGETSEVDVSLLSSAMWMSGMVIAPYLHGGSQMRVGLPKVGGASVNPFIGHFKTSDGRVISLFIMVPDPYIRDTFAHLGIPEAADDPRFANGLSCMENSAAASALIEAAFAAQTLRLLARAPENDEGPMGGSADLHGPRRRSAGAGKRCLLHRRSDRWLAADEGGAQPRPVRPPALQTAARARAWRTHQIAAARAGS